MRIILLNPVSSASRKPVLPMSLLALAAWLENRYPYAIVDGNLVQDPAGDIRGMILEKNGPVILGITVMPGPQLLQAAQVSAALKQAIPGERLRIVWGGYFPTLHADVCLESGLVDMVVRGHGETAFLRLVKAWDRSQALTGIPNLAFRDASGKIIFHPLEPLPCPDRLPPYPYHRLPLRAYVRKTHLGAATIGHHSSYGCPHRCGFCAVAFTSQGKWRPASAERTVRDVTRLIRMSGADSVEFYDNNFFADSGRALAIAEGLRSENLAWWAQGRMDDLAGLTETKWEHLRRSGLRMVFTGVETASEEQLRRMNKGYADHRNLTLELVRRMRKARITPELSFILGLPPDPAEDLRKTRAFILEIKRSNPETEIVFYIYTPVPSLLNKDSVAAPFVFPETLEQWLSPEGQDFSLRRSGKIPWLPPGFNRRIRDFQRVVNAFHPSGVVVNPRPAVNRLMKFLSAWRYFLGFYRWPLELILADKLLHFERPETGGF